MTEKKIRWTEQQRQAIVARGSDVLVTASAGTGKTAVLSGRCVDIISDKSICPDVWSILVLTFTDMAAEEMRSRIAAQLSRAFTESKDPELRLHLRRQIILLQGSDISTIHSFCKRLITEYFYKCRQASPGGLSLDPTFKVIDADEAKLLKAEVLEKTIDWAWQQSNLQQALEQLLYRRDLSLGVARDRRTNDGFLAKIIELSDFLDGVVSRQNWYERAARLTEIANPFATGLGHKQKQIVADKLRYILAQVRYALKLYEGEKVGGNWAKKWKDNFVEPIAKYIELIEAGNWEKFSKEIRNYQRPSRYEYKPKDLSGPVAEIIRSVTETARKSFDKLFELAILNPDYLDALSGSINSQTKVLIELVKKFDRLYSQAKRAANCLDFADLEHYALRLLTAEGSSEDKPTPSEVALSLRQRYKHIFVDEYQDINSVQRLILDMLSPGGNILEVGDIKQSIYAFRGAEPDIFIEHLKLASSDPENVPHGLRVALNANFRSNKGILDFVNKVFSRIMTASGLGRIDYDESAHLKLALDFKDEPQGSLKHVVEFHILDETGKDTDLHDNDTMESDSDENLNVVSSRQRQAVMIAQRIKQMVGAETGKVEFQIYDKDLDKFRDVEYRDIVILMRSLAKKANDYVEVLQSAGVPVSCQATAGYFETTEITDMLCLLKVLDNPQRDIELAAVLRSPFFNVSDTELAKIKLHSKADQQHKNFYDCVLEYSNHGKDANLAKKLKSVVTQLEQWRTLARRGNLADLIWRIYRQTHFLAFVLAQPSGKARKANLLKLHDRAIQFEGFVTSSGIPSLTRFIYFIEKLQETGQDWAPAEPEASAGNAVRILSVHKSKGLEFPVVFLAELNSGFNKRDIYADVLADADDTLGLQIIDRASNSKLCSLAHQVIAEERLEKLLAEEMRILYVATTRAKDRLILTASQKRNHCRSVITNGFFFANEMGGTLPDWQLRACQSPLDWILYALSDQKILLDGFESGLAKEAQNDDLFSLKLYNQAELKRLSEFVIRLKEDRRQETEDRRLAPTSAVGVRRLDQLKKSLEWRYGYYGSTLLPAKSSVTQLTHRNDEYVKFDYSSVLEKEPHVKHGAKILAGGITVGSHYDNLAFGSATHLVISKLDLRLLGDKFTPAQVGEAIQRTKEKLVADGSVTEDIIESINTESILAFFDSELGRMALDKANTVWREWPFTFALPVNVLRDAYCVSRFELCTTHNARRTTHDETVVVQGIIDMLIRTPKGLVVIDFKTDNISAKQVPQRVELYRQQIELYAKAASSVLKEKLLAKWLYFLTTTIEFEIKS